MELFGKHYRGCIFDFDGVLMDTEQYHYAAWNRAMEPEGVCLTWEEYLPLKSTGRGHIIRQYSDKAPVPFPQEHYPELARRKEQIFAELIRALSPSDILPGAEAFMAYLKSRGVRLAIASSSTATTELARRFGLDRYVSAVIDGNRNLPKKPAPDLFRTAADALELAPEDCLVFEDSLAGIQAAGNAGMDAVAVGGIRSPTAIAHIRDYLDILLI